MTKTRLRQTFCANFRICLFVICAGLIQTCGSEDRRGKSKESDLIGECPTDFLIAKAVIFNAVTICATKNVTLRKVKHAAAVTAQWLDNDQDGAADEPRLIRALAERRPVLFMSQAGFSWRQMNKIEETLNERAGQDLAGDETAPNEGRDASQEEIHHLIVTAGWKRFLPEVFSDDLSVESSLSKAWQSAEDKSLYEYGDPTCDPRCKIIEFFYLSTAAYLGSFIDVAHDELRVKTPPDLRKLLPEVVAIMESSAYAYPKNMWPDGNYRGSGNIIFTD